MTCFCSRPERVGHTDPSCPKYCNRCYYNAHNCPGCGDATGHNQPVCEGCKKVYA